MTVSQALQFMENIPRIKSKLKTVEDVGLGYIRLGQAPPPSPAAKPSGSNWPRSSPSGLPAGPSISSTNRPPACISTISPSSSKCLQNLVEGGNTVVVIEHNLDVIKTADWVIDLGPEGGDRGGEIVACGTPEQVARCAKSYTGRYLRSYFESLSEKSWQAFILPDLIRQLNQLNSASRIDVADLCHVDQVVGFLVLQQEKALHRVDKVKKAVASLGHLNGHGTGKLLAADKLDVHIFAVPQRFICRCFP